MRVQIVDQDNSVLLESADPGLVRAAGTTIAVYAAGAREGAGDHDGALRYKRLYDLVIKATEPISAQ